MYSWMSNSNNEEGLMKSVGPFQFNSSYSATSAGSTGIIMPIGSFPVGTTTHHGAGLGINYSLDEGENELSLIEEAALEISMNMHSKALDILARH